MLDITGFYNRPITNLTLTGQINRVGILRILGHLRESYPAEFKRFDPGQIDWIYNGQSGKISKQTARVWRKLTDHKLTDSDKMMIGTVARYFSNGESIYFDLTNDFTWSDGDYGDHGSCFWTDGGEYRGAIYDADGSAIRSYSSQYGQGIGRAWVMPTQTRQTSASGDFDALGESREYVIFNNYGSPDIQVFAETLRQTLCAKYAVPICADYSDTYMNAGTHYLITDRSAHYLYTRHYSPDALNYKSASYPSVNLSSEYYCDRETRYCQNCQSRVNLSDCMSDDYGDGDYYCIGCWSEHYTSCENCDQTIGRYDAQSHNGSDYCDYCYDRVCRVCDICGERSERKMYDDVNGYDQVCSDCRYDLCSRCENCDDLFHADDMQQALTTDGSKTLCDSCADDLDYCENCGHMASNADLQTIPGHSVCAECATGTSACPICDVLTDSAGLYRTTGSDHIMTALTVCCDRCASERYDLTVVTPDGSVSLIDLTPDPSAPFVRSAEHNGLIAYMAQQSERYYNQTALPVRSAGSEPIALLSGPIADYAEQQTNYYGLLVGYNDPVCDQCRAERVRVEWSYDQRRLEYINLIPNPDLCVNCCHLPDAKVRPDQSGPSDIELYPVYTRIFRRHLYQELPNQETGR